jgi:5'-deoxynucleotidase YfbR-like HD superfamily hydrolase
MEKEVENMEDVVRMVFDFSKINRVTMSPDGVPESDTDHTVMMSVLACAVAEKFYKDLSLGLVAQFAIVHDLLEVYTGDFDTFKTVGNDELFLNKKNLEVEALKKMETRFRSTYPWIINMVDKYESLDTIEARFVKTLDKIIPKVTNVANGGMYFRKNSLSKEDVEGFKNVQVEKVKNSYGAEFPELISIFEAVNKKVSETCF